MVCQREISSELSSSLCASQLSHDGHTSVDGPRQSKLRAKEIDIRRIELLPGTILAATVSESC